MSRRTFSTFAVLVCCILAAVVLLWYAPRFEPPRQQGDYWQDLEELVQRQSVEADDLRREIRQAREGGDTALAASLQAELTRLVDVDHAAQIEDLRSRHGRTSSP